MNNSSSEIEVAEVIFWEYKYGDILYMYPITFLLIVGTAGNAVSFAVYSRRRMSQSVTSLYFRVLAIADTGLLYAVPLPLWYWGIFKHDFRTDSSAACKIFNACGLSSCYFACWTLVLVASDRFIGIYFPHKYKQLCTKRRATLSMAILFICIVSSGGAFLLTVLDRQENGSCGVSPKYLPFFLNVFRWLEMGVLNLTPTLVLIGLNAAIITKLVRSAKLRQQSTAGSQSSSDSGVTNATAILVSISIAYFLCTIPISTYFMIENAVEKTPKNMARLFFYHRVCDVLWSMNHGANFFLYCMHGTAFRKELLAMFCGKKYQAFTSSQNTNSSQMSEGSTQKSISTLPDKK